MLIMIMRWPNKINKIWGNGGRVFELLDSGGSILWGLSDRFSQPWSKNVVPELCSLWSTSVFSTPLNIFAL